MFRSARPPAPRRNPPGDDLPHDSAPPRVSIIVVSYNTRDMTLEALRSVEAETRASHELLVVDNASQDGSAEAIAAAFPAAENPGLRLWAETENHGFAQANNLASRHARGDYILLLNPDTIVLDGAVDRLLAFAEARPGAKIWGGRTLFADGALNPTNCWDHMTVWSLFCRVAGLSAAFPGSGLFNPEAYGGWPRDTVREVGIVTGCFFLIRRAFWEELGGFDRSFVMYGEEADLCRRAADAGARPMITPEARIVHHVGAASSVRAAKQVMVMRAKVTLVRRQFSGLRRAAAMALLRAWPMSRALAAFLRGRDSPWREVWARRAEWRDGWPDRRGT